jgi:succinyl-CoA synthetase beta subunit
MAVVLLGGDIGILANGAGLGLAVMDGLGARGGAAANFLDIGGAASAGDVRLAVEWMLRNERIRSILVHIFGGIVRCDLVAEGLLLALRSAPGRKPVAVRFAGTNGAEGLDLLRRSGMDFIFASSLGEALDAAVGSAASGKP